jgi:hypothetical protein
MNLTDIGLWKILGLIAITALVIFRKSKNSVWGGMTMGAIIGIVIAAVKYFSSNIFNWSFVGKSMVIGILIGVFAEILGKLSNNLKK